jgi:uncharacterized membrane protein
VVEGIHYGLWCILDVMTLMKVVVVFVRVGDEKIRKKITGDKKEALP